MADETEIADEEIIIRHIPGGTMYQAPGPRPTSMNFKLRPELAETGVSVTRLSITSPARLLTTVRSTPESKVAAARVGDVRALGLNVVPRELPHDLGHSEIQDGTASLNSELIRKRLARLFRFIDLAPTS